DKLACCYGLATTQQRVVDELHYHLTRYGQRLQNVEAYQASPWCNHYAVKKRLRKKMGFDLFANCYPGQAELQLALRNVFGELNYGEIGRADSGLLGTIRE